VSNFWEGEYIYFRDEKRFWEVMGFGFNIYIKLDRPGTKKYSKCLYASKFPSNPINVIISKEEKEQERINMNNDIQLVLDPTYLSLYWCSKTDSCIYSTNQKSNLVRHEFTCTDQTKMCYKEVTFGGGNDTKKELVALGVLPVDDPNILKFATFDIESVNVPKNDEIGGQTIIFGKQEVVSIDTVFEGVGLMSHIPPVGYIHLLDTLVKQIFFLNRCLEINDS